jgi:hypothetical protein
MPKLKMSGYNTHDFHTILSLFLAITIRAINHPYVLVVNHTHVPSLQWYIREGNRCY